MLVVFALWARTGVEPFTRLCVDPSGSSVRRRRLARNRVERERRRGGVASVRT